MIKRRIQLKLNERIFCVKVPKDTKTDDTETILNALQEKISNNNEKESIIFYEEIELVCSECGISLNSPEEIEDGRCSQCEALIVKEKWKQYKKYLKVVKNE